jgi:manganese transport protein
MDSAKHGIAGKIGLLLAAVGPGLFMIGYNIGTGSITTMASAGSRYGLSLMWTLILSCVFTFVLLVAYSRFTLVSGETAMRGYRNHLPVGKWLAIYTIIVLTIGELAALAGITGIVTELINEWIAIVLGVRIGMFPIAAVILFSCFGLLWVGRYSSFEKFLTALVVIIGACFFMSLFLVVPEPKDLFAGLMPKIPNAPNALIIIASMAGTTCSAMVFVMRCIIVAEKGWNKSNLKQDTVDSFVSVTVMFVLSAAVMACAAGTLFKMGVPVERAVDMVKTLEPLAGRFAISIFTLGIVGAGISTLFPVALIMPWLICDYRGIDRNIQTPLFRILGGLGLLIGFTVPVFGGRPVWIMIFSNAFQATILPIVTLAIIALLNSKKIMGEHRSGGWINIGLLATLAFSLVTSYIGVLGFLESLKNVLG